METQEEMAESLEAKEMPNIRQGMFKDIISGLFETYKKKNADYNGSFEKLFKEFGMTYSIIHLQEKLERIKSLQNKSNDVEGETYIDSLEDLANYAILTLIELRLKKDKQ